MLISTTGLWDEEGNLEPYSEEEVERRARVAEELCETARDSRDLKGAAEAIGLTPIESSVGIRNEGDGQEPRMLDAARLLEVGDVFRLTRWQKFCSDGGRMVSGAAYQ